MIVAIYLLLTSAMVYLSQGPADMWWFAWVAFAPILFLAYGETRWWRLFLASMAAYALGQFYLFECYAKVIPIPVIGAQIAVLALLFAAAVIFARYIIRRVGAFAALIAFPACWTALEYLCGVVSPNGTFGALGYSQVSAPALIQSASLFGLYSVTFLICLVANMVALALHGGRNGKMAAVVGIAFCVLNAVFGLVRLSETQLAKVRVAALADNDGTVAAYRAGTRDGYIRLASQYARAIRNVAAQDAVFAITAEGGIITRPEWEDAVFAPLAAAARDAKIEIVAGILQRNPAADLAVTFGSGGITQRYFKRHLVPGLENEFAPGVAPGILGDGRAVVICKDMDFPATIRNDAKNGIRVMAVPSGDFVTDGWIHARMAILRGVENGFAVVRAADDGLLTVSDAEGRIVARRGDAPHGVYSLVANVSPGPGPTLYTRIGDAFAWAAIAATLAFGALGLLLKRK